MLLSGGQLSLTRHNLGEHLSRRYDGAVPDPKKVLSPEERRRLHGTRWVNADDVDADPLITMQPCSGASTQQWAWNVTGQWYLSNIATGLCMNTDDCGTGLIAYECITTGGTCCGAQCYDNLKFHLNSDGTLRTPSQPGMCATYHGTGSAVDLQPCVAGSSLQYFQWDAAAKTLSMRTPSGNQCLSVGGAAGGQAVIGRPLADGDWALGFFNSGATNATVSCDSTCLQGTGWETGQVLTVRDLYAHTDLPEIVVGSESLSVYLAADGGSALYKLTPKFNATIPLY